MSGVRNRIWEQVRFKSWFADGLYLLQSLKIQASFKWSERKVVGPRFGIVTKLDGPAEALDDLPGPDGRASLRYSVSSRKLRQKGRAGARNHRHLEKAGVCPVFVGR